VERIRVEAAEVAHAGERERNQAIQEFVHASPAKRDLATDIQPFAQAERGDALASLAADWLLAGEFGERGSGVVDVLLVLRGATDAHADDYLLEPWQRQPIFAA